MKSIIGGKFAYMIPNDLAEAVENIVDGWYADPGPIDWIDFLDRLERQTGEDLGCDMLSPQIQAIQSYARVYRKMGV